MPSERPNVNFRADRKRAFIIDDDQERGPASFHASKRLRGTTKSISAVAVREHGTDKFCKVLRFLFQVLETLARRIETWIAVSRSNVFQQYLLYSAVCRDVAMSETTGDSMPLGVERTALESFLLEDCLVLTLGQRCSDWFALRQLRVTATNAGALFASSEQFCQLTGVSQIRIGRTLNQWFDLFMASWFRNKRSTEAMKRGSITEDAFLEALRICDSIYCLFPCGMLGKRGGDYVACSPDGIALFDVNQGPSHIIDERLRGVQVGNTSWGVASVEIKTSVAEITVGELLSLATPDFIYCKIGDRTFKKYVRERLVGQVLHQMIVLHVNFCIYVRASE